MEGGQRCTRVTRDCPPHRVKSDPRPALKSDWSGRLFFFLKKKKSDQYLLKKKSVNPNPGLRTLWHVQKINLPKTGPKLALKSSNKKKDRP